jgi:hypothetical protein
MWGTKNSLKNETIERQFEMEGPTITSISNFWQAIAADIRAAGQSISRVLRHTTVHNHAHNRPPLASYRNHPNSAHTLTTPFRATLILSLYQFLATTEVASSPRVLGSNFCESNFKAERSYHVNCSDNISKAILDTWRPSLPHTIMQWRQ